MKHTHLSVLAVLLLTTVSTFGQGTILVINKTGQRINQLDYWIGSETQAQDVNLLYKSRGSLESDSTARIPEKFDKKKRNTILIRANLSGGGYVRTPYSISEKEKIAPIKIFNPAQSIPQNDFKKVVDKFKELKVDSNFRKIPTNVALRSVLGSLFVYDSTEKKILYKIRPNELKSVLSNIIEPETSDNVIGVFSSETSIQNKLNLPFVNINSAFEFGDVAKFHWTIENVGEFIWSSEKGEDLATLFSQLSSEAKKALISIYAQNRGAKMKFIDEVFLIGRIEVETERSKKIDMNAEINGSSFITAKGNYSFNEYLKQKSVIKSIVTQIDGYYVTSLLTSLYLNSLLESKQKLTAEENQRVIDEYNYLLSLYPEILKPTTNVEIMKAAIKELNTKLGQISYLIPKENKEGKKTPINPEDVTKEQQNQQ
jgi:hypothetical protein